MSGENWVVNHKEAEELARIKKGSSNLARCYLALLTRATPPGFEMVPEETRAKLLEASSHLAWAAEVEIQVGRRPRAFVRQHRAKVRFWIDSVRAILAAHRAAQNDVACAHEWQRTKTEVCEYDFCPKCLAVGDKMTGQVFARFPESSRKKPKETPNAQG